MVCRFLLMGQTFLVLLFSGSLFAESRMIFPRIIFQQSRFSGFAIANPTSAPANVTFKAYNPDGSPFGNPVSVTIAAGSQYAKLATEIFSPPASVAQGATPTRLWMEA